MLQSLLIICPVVILLFHTKTTPSNNYTLGFTLAESTYAQPKLHCVMEVQESSSAELSNLPKQGKQCFPLLMLGFVESSFVLSYNRNNVHGVSEDSQLIALHGS